MNDSIKRLVITIVTASAGLAILLTLGVLSPNSLRKSSHSHVIHNGGKPRPQLDLMTSEDSPLSPDTWTWLPIMVTSNEECNELVVRFHGVDGIEVQNAKEPQSLGQCEPEQPLQTEVRVRASAGTAGYLIADFSMDDRGTSRAIALKVGSAKHRAQASGKAKLAPDGSSFIELNPHAQ